ncbi:hypothetical protein BsWGS_04184 [Bradybaena similaris]
MSENFKATRVIIMDDFRNNYRGFMDDLIPFVDLVSQRHKRGAPHALQYVKLIPIIMKTTDPDLEIGRIDEVLIKFTRVWRVTHHVLNYLHLYVRDEFKEWVQSQIKKLTRWLELCDTSLDMANTKNEKPPTTVMPSAIGGTNPGVEERVSDE